MAGNTHILDTLIQLCSDAFDRTLPETSELAPANPAPPHWNFCFVKYSVSNFFLWWHSLSDSKRYKYSAGVASALLGLYIVYPTIFPSSQSTMFAKRPDKYVTGLINLTTDCFANSTLQSLAALPSLNNYLNGMSIYHSTVLGVCQSSQVAENHLNPPSMPLHTALVDLLAKLQETILSNRVISVWDFLHTLERIYNSKISRNQHDAHELLQLILETLENEYSSVKRFVVKHHSIFDKVFQDNGIPDFPFSSEISSKLICTRCGKKSSVNYDPMIILSMPVPQTSSIGLQSLVQKSLQENIDDYSCLRCKINFIINDNDNSKLSSPEAIAALQNLKDWVASDKLLINDDLPASEQKFVDSYPQISDPHIKSTVCKTTNFIMAPKVLPIHLSRSIFENTQAWRNSCNVEFEEHLIITVDEAEKKEFEATKASKTKGKSKPTANGGNEDEDNTEDYSNGEDSDDFSETVASTRPVSLSTKEEKAGSEFVENVDDDDVDDEVVHDADLDDIDEEEDEEEEDQDEEDLQDVDDDEDDIAAEGDDGTPAQRPMFQPSFSSEKFPSSHMFSTPSTSASELPPTAATSIPSQVSKIAGNKPAPAPKLVTTTPMEPSSDSKTTTKTYRYRLRAVIRHQGSHSLGHYECYRRKPVFYKDANTGDYFTKFPKLIDSRVSRQEGVIAAVQNLTISYSDDEAVASPKLASHEEAFSDVSETESASSSIKTRPRRSSSLSKRLRNSFSSLRRASIQGSSDEVIPESSAISSSPSNKEAPKSPLLSSTTEKKNKKVSSSIKFPFWRISDSKVKETASVDVMADSKAVYMLFYERLN